MIDARIIVIITANNLTNNDMNLIKTIISKEDTITIIKEYLEQKGILFDKE